MVIFFRLFTSFNEFTLRTRLHLGQKARLNFRFFTFLLIFTSGCDTVYSSTWNDESSSLERNQGRKQYKRDRKKNYKCETCIRVPLKCMLCVIWIKGEPVSFERKSANSVQIRSIRYFITFHNDVDNKA